MRNQDKHDAWLADLRAKAHEIARNRSFEHDAAFEAGSQKKMRELIHELQVQQIELEIQNEQMRLIQAELDVARIRYTDLFNMAPAGYLTLDENGLIQEVNQSASTLLGVVEDELIDQDITRFIASEDQDTFNLFLGQLPQFSESRDCELSMQRSDGARFWTWLGAVLTPEGPDRAPHVLLLIIDISRRKQIEKENLQVKSLLETAGHLAKFGGWSVDLAENRVHFCGQTAQIHGAPPDFSPTLEEAIEFYTPEWREKIATNFHNCATKGEPFDEEMEIVTLQGEKIWIRTTGQAIRDASGQIHKVEGAFQDITERKKTEESLRASAAEKEVLLREVHHRVKNNLAIIVSLLELHHSSVTDAGTVAQLQDLGDRIKSIALVHEQLYCNENMSRIDFQNYLETLIKDLCLALKPNEQISCVAEAHGVELNLELAVPCGLIVNELMTNALKHAFPDGKSHDGLTPPEIRCNVQVDNGTCHLVMVDNGVGIPPEMDVWTSNSFGLQMVRLLGTHQLRGRLDLERDKGTRVSLSFELKK